MSNQNKLKKFSLSFVLAVFSFVTFFGAIVFSPVPARAQFGQTLIDMPRMISELGQNIADNIKAVFITSAIKAVSYFMRKVAYDSAVWLASGGKGQSPFAHTNGFGDYLGNVAGDAAAEGISTFGTTFGLDLCKIPDVKVDLALRIGLRNRFLDQGVPREGQCDFTQLKEGWSSETANSMYGSEGLSNRFNASLSPDMDSDLGIYLKSSQKIDNLITNRVSEKKADREEGQGFKGLTGLINGDVKTPAQVMAEGFRQQTPDKAQQKSENEINAVLASGAYQIIPATLSTFLNTLASQMLKNYQENGMLPFGVCGDGLGGSACDQSGVATFEGSGTAVAGRDAAQAAFSQFLVAKPTVLDKYDLVPQLSSCPDTPGIYNCRIDGDFAEVIKTENYDKPITIEDALASTKLHGDWKLIPPSNALDSDKNCFEKNAYCYSNIKVLRQARIVPLGFEIAAKNSDPDHPWSLGDVVKGFYDCNYQKDATGNIVGVNYDPVNKPYCHLIDPRWVLKSPPARCNALASGSSLLIPDAPTRLDECVDMSTCVAFNKDGTCLSYGYCAREKNTWRFEADKCDSYNATCKAFTDATGNQVAYLYRTLDTGSCNQNTAGCMAYSLQQDEKGGGWIEPKYDPALSPVYLNTGIHFNNKLSSGTCSAPGCSAFNVETPQGNELRHLKKAPDYLKCYDANPTTLAVELPENNADLAKMKPRPECNQYAGVCIPSEIGCNWFTSILTGEAIPGRFKPAEIVDNQVTNWNDQCDARCDGYAAYKEMPTNYSNGQEVAYVIPPNSTNNAGATCLPEEDSCTSFTNMGEAVSGGEKVEYFTYLRPCIKPDATKQKNFYTYEGADGAIGYQLKSYTLEKDVDGSPKYWARTATEMAQYLADCTADRYQKGLTSADCRQFNDDQGNVYYRLLRQVVVVNDSCTNYRLNSSEFASVSGNTYTCFQNGEYRDGFCYYFGLPDGIATTAGKSNACAKSAESCRPYKGNAANRVRDVFGETLTFENDKAIELAGWSISGGSSLTPTISSESTQTKGHSLNHSGGGTLQKSFDVQIGKSYVLSFWAKGNKKDVSVNIFTDQKNTVGVFSVSDVWQYYTMTSKDISGNIASGTLQFAGGTIQGGGGTLQLYIDNINLKEITDYLYLVKKTLKVDPICDSEPNDNLPGEALGCTGYNDPNNNPFYLTNFSYLCREGAIGCAKMFDTYNTPDDAKAEAYNVWLTAGSDSSGQKLSVKIANETFSCQVAVGETGCYTNIKGYTNDEITGAQSASIGLNVSASFKKSTAYIPADNTDPIYLVINQDSVCTEVDRGCTFAGLMTQTPMGVKFITTTIINDPATYDQMICSSEAVGCNNYSVGQGSYYFKDPAVTGQKVCAYNNKTTVNGQVASGWFWKGVGQCAAGKNTTNNIDSNAKECVVNDDCITGQTCQNIGNIPCYPYYVQTGNDYGLWSYGDKASGKYDNFVGQCPAEQSSCTEYVDKNDKKNPADKGHSYFFLANNKINSGDCDGLTSLKYGCVLFDQTDKPGKLWETAATYIKSDQADGKKIEPVKNPHTLSNDANTIIKVSADRECGEWLACQNTERVWDDKRGTYKNICTSVGRCNQKPSTAAQENIYNCANFMSDQENLYANKVLTEDLYVGRKVTWNYQEFSGYSILNSYPPEELEQVNISKTIPDWRLVKTIPCGKGANCVANMPTSSVLCNLNADTGGCGFGNLGICMNGYCLQNINGTKNLAGGSTINELATPSPVCRAYPEKTSPFPNIKTLGASNAFVGANVCNEIFGPLPNTGPSTTLAYSCDCDYNKVEYGDSGVMTKYFDYINPNKNSVQRTEKNKDDIYAQSVLNAPDDIPPGVCLGGSKDGNSCSSNSGCMEGPTSTVGGVCQLKKKINQYLGWRGYCLEPDISRNLFADSDQHPCLTWLPVDKLFGVPDIYNQYKDAGFEAKDSSNYCLQVEKYSKPLAFSKCWDPNGPDEGYSDKKEKFCVPDYNDNYENSRCPDGYDYYLYTGDGEGITDLPGEKWGNCWYGDKQSTNCGVVCKPKADIKDKWILNSPFPVQETTIGCAATLKIDNNNVVAWTNRLFSVSSLSGYQVADYKGYKISPKDLTAAQGVHSSSFQYQYFSPQSPFASLYDDPFQSILLSVQFCFQNINDAIVIVPPKLKDDGKDSECVAPSYNPPSGYTFSDRLTYDPTWDLGIQPKNQCEVPADCNKVSVGECVISDPAVEVNCGKKCTLDADCNIPLAGAGLPPSLTGAGINFDKCGANGFCIKAVTISKAQMDSLGFAYGSDSCKYIYSNTAGGGTQNVGYCNGANLKCLTTADCNTVKNDGKCLGIGGSDVKCVKTCNIDNDCKNVTNKYDTDVHNYGACDQGTKTCKTSAYQYNSDDVTNGIPSHLQCTLAIYGPGYKYTGICSNSDNICGQDSECSAGTADQMKCELDGAIKVCKGPGYINSTPSANAYKVNYSQAIYDAYKFLKNIFAKIDLKDVWVYLSDSLKNPNDPSQGYDGKNNYAQIDLGSAGLNGKEADFNITESASSVDKAPQVRAVGECNSDLSKCLMEKEGITINDKWKDDAKIYTNPARAIMKFYAFANSDQMPLKNVYIDWGDGQKQSSVDGYYRNHIGAQNVQCNVTSHKCVYDALAVTKVSDATVPEVNKGSEVNCNSDADCKFIDSCSEKERTNIFGQVLGLTCDNSYFQYGHVYQCTKESGYWKDGDSCPDSEMGKNYGGCCVYKPKVQVKDNWGWYNGSGCGDASSPGGVGCYDDNVNDKDENEGQKPGARTSFNNNVIVAPQK